MGTINNHNFLSSTNTNDPLEEIIDKYKKNPSITCINKHKTNSKLTFTFQPVIKKSV